MVSKYSFDITVLLGVRCGFSNRCTASRPYVAQIFDR